jgi:hypothetical protein
VQLDYVVRNVDNLQEVKPNGFGDFTLLEGPYGSQSISIDNGVRTNSIKVSYIVRPNKEGKITIPPASARDASGHVYQSNPITIEVVPGSLAPKQQRRPAQMMGDEDDDPMAQFQQQIAQFQQLQAQLQRIHQAQIQQMMAPPPASGGRPMPQQAPQGKQQPAEPPIDEAQLKAKYEELENRLNEEHSMKLKEHAERNSYLDVRVNKHQEDLKELSLRQRELEDGNLSLLNAHLYICQS